MRVILLYIPFFPNISIRFGFVLQAAEDYISPPLPPPSLESMSVWTDGIKSQVEVWLVQINCKLASEPPFGRSIWQRSNIRLSKDQRFL